jgi:putative hydrolase of the HAD superfamily
VAIRGVLFDWDGTVVRGEPFNAQAAAEAIAAYARKHLEAAVLPDEFLRAFQAVLPEYKPGVTEQAPNIQHLLGAAFTWLGLAVGVNDVESCARLFFQEASRDVTVYDDARALLASLRYRGYRTGVVTNSLFPSSRFEPKVNELGLAGYIDAFVSSADVGLAKPNPSPYLKALDGVGLEPHEAVFVGDTAATDIAGARAAGMRAFLLERADRARDRSGYLVIERLTALNDLLGDGPAG